MEEVKVGKVSIPIVKGEKGDVGPAGATGPAGKTPQAGIDYYTEEEKAQMQENILSEVLSEVLGDVKTITFDEETGILTIIRNTGESYQIDLPIERLVKSGYYDEANKQIVLNLDNDTTIEIPVSSLIDDVYTTIEEQAIKIEELEKQNKQLLKDHKPIPFNAVSSHLQDTGELPMPISINGGIEQDTREGYNLLDTSEFVEEESSGITLTKGKNGTVILNGTSTGSTMFRILRTEKSILGTGNERLIINQLSGSISVGDLKFIAQDTDYGNLAYSQIGTAIINQKLINGITYNIFAITITTGTVCNNLELGLVISSSKTDFEQYGAMPSIAFPSEVKGVSGHYDTVVENKNRFNINTCTRDKSLSQTDGKTLSNATDVVVSDYIGVIPKNSYYISSLTTALTVRVFYYDKYKNYISNAVASVTGNTALLNITDNVYFMKIQGNKTFLDNEFQVEKGTVKTPYTPHQEQNLPLDIPFNMYSGKAYKENGKWYRPIEWEKVNLVDLVITNVVDLGSFTRISLLGAYNSKGGGYKAYSNYSKHLQKYSEQVEHFYVENDSKVYLFINNNDLISIDKAGAEDFIANHSDMYFVYQSLTPTIEEITDATLISQLEELQKAHSYYEVTNINSYGSGADLVLSGNALMSNDIRLSKLESALLSLGGISNV